MDLVFPMGKWNCKWNSRGHPLPQFRTEQVDFQGGWGSGGVGWGVGEWGGVWGGVWGDGWEGWGGEGGRAIKMGNPA